MIKQMRIPVVKKKIRQENKSKKERMKIKIWLKKNRSMKTQMNSNWC